MIVIDEATKKLWDTINQLPAGTDVHLPVTSYWPIVRLLSSLCVQPSQNIYLKDYKGAYV